MNRMKNKNNQKKIDFKTWSQQVYQVYGNNGMMMLNFAFSCICSDHIYHCNEGFPVMFVYGQGASGKSSLVNSLQLLFGPSQISNPIHRRSSLYKTLLREWTDLNGTMVHLEEYVNDLPDDTVEFLKGIWERKGYKRATLDSDLPTQTVSTNPGVVISGNEYPVDDLLVQRAIILEMQKDCFSEAEHRKFYQLKAMEKNGISCLLKEILPCIDHITKAYKPTYSLVSDLLKTRLEGLFISNRMIKNLATLATVFKIVSERLEFPYS